MLKNHRIGLASRLMGTFLPLALLVVVGLPGCGRKVEYQAPKTYPVTGKVIAPPGKLQEGSEIVFAPQEAGRVARGRIEADGSFTLRLLFHEKWLPGATEGPHRVTVRPVVNKGPGDPIPIKQPYIIEPKENNFTITIK
jgi:hypothetical protein